MPIINDEAVVLGRLDYSEASQILVLFTRDHGKVRAIAKGVKRSTKTRFAVGVDLLDFGRVVLGNRQERGESLATMTEWKQTRSLSGLRESLERIHTAQYVAEISAHLIEDWDPHPTLFDALTETLGLLAVVDPCHALLVALRYQHKLLDEIGSLPRFDACVVCGRESDLTHFSSFEGGFVCRHCEPGRVEKWQIGPESIAVLRWMGEGDSASPADSPSMTSDEVAVAEGFPCASRISPATPGSQPPPGIVASFAVLNYHIAHLMGREPRLADRLVPSTVRRTL